jgi:hypothetical protein
MPSLGSIAWPLGFLAILAAGFLLFVQAGLAPWFSLILVATGLLLFAGFAITVTSTKDDTAPFRPARARTSRHDEADEP